MAARAPWRWVYASARWRIVADCPVPPFVGDPQRRQNYITPYFAKCPPVSRGAPFVAATASRPAGLQKRRYAKLPTLERARQPSALPGRWRALRAAACRPVGVLAPGHQHSAARSILVSGLRPSIGCWPPPTPGPRRCAASAARLPVRPPRGLPQYRAGGRGHGRAAPCHMARQLILGGGESGG